MTVDRRLKHRHVPSVAGSSVGWSPEDIAHTAAFWLADDIALPEGTAVSSWPDRGPQNRPLGQGTATNQPLYRTAGINGQPAVDFDGTDNFMFTTDTISASNGGSVFVVTVVDTMAESALWSSVDEAVTTRYMIGTLRLAGSVNTMASEQRNADTADNMRAPTNAITTATVYFQEWQSTDANTYVFRINGVSQTITVLSGSNNGDWFGDTTGRDNFAVGAQKFATPSGFYNGKIGFVYVNDQRLIDAADRARLYEWVAAKYQITIT